MTSPFAMRSTRVVQIAHMILAMLAAVVIASLSDDWLGSDAECEPGLRCQAATASPKAS